MSDCCSSNQPSASDCGSGSRGTVEGKMSPSTKVLTDKWSFYDRVGHILCRINNRFRMNYRVEPGLYSMGNPGPDSEVFVSANYRLSFDHLRKALFGMDAWILVLDTKGINVWCAAGKGTFGTEELINRIGRARLEQIVEHRGIVVPQLGAPGIAAHEVKRQTGFRVIYGPVHARDIPEFVRAGYKAAPAMRRIRFDFLDRLILTPMELVPALKWFLLASILWLIVSGLSRSGISFESAWEYGGFAVIAGLAGIVCGAFLTPVLLPLIPGRSFAVKGALAGLLGSAVLQLEMGPIGAHAFPILLLGWVAVPGLSSFLAFNFTGASTFTSPSGVRQEFRIAVPLYLLSGIAIAAALVLLWAAR